MALLQNSVLLTSISLPTDIPLGGRQKVRIRVWVRFRVRVRVRAGVRGRVRVGGLTSEFQKID